MNSITTKDAASCRKPSSVFFVILTTYCRDRSIRRGDQHSLATAMACTELVVDVEEELHSRASFAVIAPFQS